MEPRRSLSVNEMQATLTQLRWLNLGGLATFLEWQWEDNPVWDNRIATELVEKQAEILTAVERSTVVLRGSWDPDEPSPVGAEGGQVTDNDWEQQALEETGGTKHDTGKPRFDLIPTYPLEAAASVFAFGAQKYGDRNWEQGISYGRLYGALQRHLSAFWRGEETDPESGLPHLGHAMCCLMMLSEERLNPTFNEDVLDDRPPH